MRLNCGKKRCLLLLNAFCLLFFIYCFYLRPSISLVRLSSLVYWKTYTSNDTSESSLFHHSSPVVIHSSLGEANVTDDDPCIRNFLAGYQKFCETRLTKGNASQLCPCIPDTLDGYFPINESVALSLNLMENNLTWLTENGRWRPPGCVARQRLAIIIPYADRKRHLRMFLSHMHPFLQRQLVDYSIFVIEQLSPELFNRAMLMNVGFVEANSTDAFDCFIFHDIDQLPIDDRNFYVCSELPRHVVGYRKKFNYNYAYSTSFGGGNSFTRQEFEAINGYSNSFYGWGGEDDDLYQRTEAKHMRRSRYPRCIAKYDEIKHERDKRNPMGVNQQLGFKFRPDVYQKDGLNSLNYSVVSREIRRLFTKISVSLPDPPPSNSKKQKSGFVELLASVFRLLFGSQNTDPEQYAAL